MAKCGGKFKHKRIRQKSPPQCISNPSLGPNVPKCDPGPILTPTFQINFSWATIFGQVNDIALVTCPQNNVGQWLGDIIRHVTIGGIPKDLHYFVNFIHNASICEERMNVTVAIIGGGGSTSGQEIKPYKLGSPWKFPTRTIPTIIGTSSITIGLHA